ncbi:MAG TPA: hypothetical protein DIT03_06800, partial [Candidatus Accumulibacter sp.]|nr:hypothetical protein [Accumulibacter sp.]
MNAQLPPALIELLPADCRATAELLNRGCACISVDHESLRRELAASDRGAPVDEWLASRPHLFADSMVFVSEVHLERMARTIAAVERVVALPAYRQ